ncbi:MAG: hypothetical protein IH586_09400 [Anaerolineaceae bacterium]|nr:hypothetical protein [Anaerolineaceae bacterium]
MASYPGILQIVPAGERSARFLVEEEAVIPALTAELMRRGEQIFAIRPQPISLEEVYFALQEKDREARHAQG